jgi:hypothetical protein
VKVKAIEISTKHLMQYISNLSLLPQDTKLFLAFLHLNPSDSKSKMLIFVQSETFDDITESTPIPLITTINNF